MPVSVRIFILMLLLSVTAGCKSKKKPSPAGEETITVSDLLDFFKPVSLPFQYTDTALLKNEKDSLLISYKNFTSFVPDTVLSKVYAKNKKIKIYALGKIDMDSKGTYLFVKTVAADKRVLYILFFNGKNEFATSFRGLQPDNNRSTQQIFTMDRKLGITKTISVKNADGSVAEGKDVYSLSSDEKSFALVMTDPLNDRVTELINPLDTLPRKNKFSADYSAGKMNMVSVRDGRRPGSFIFFIHIEKNNGECVGELKGDALFKTPTSGEYRLDGDPCKLKFIFTNNGVTLQEQEGCGSRRGLNCTFNGSFAKQKKPATPVKKPAAKK